TGVQTCALPICGPVDRDDLDVLAEDARGRAEPACVADHDGAAAGEGVGVHDGGDDHLGPHAGAVAHGDGDDRQGAGGCRGCGCWAGGHGAPSWCGVRDCSFATMSRRESTPPKLPGRVTTWRPSAVRLSTAPCPIWASGP